MAQPGALHEFRRTIGFARALLRMERRRYADPPRPRQMQAAMAMRGGAAVLMVAAFESFVRSAAEQHVDMIRSHPRGIDFAKLPDAMRVRNVYGALESAMRGPAFQEPSPRVQRLPQIELACSQIASRILEPTAFSDTGGNPDSRRLKDVCKGLGDDKVFTNAKTRFEVLWGQPIAGTFVEDKLDEIVRRRHVVAHTASALNVTRQDLDEGITFLVTLSTAVSAELRRQRAVIAKVCV